MNDSLIGLNNKDSLLVIGQDEIVNKLASIFKEMAQEFTSRVEYIGLEEFQQFNQSEPPCISDEAIRKTYEYWNQGLDVPLEFKMMSLEEFKKQYE